MRASPRLFSSATPGRLSARVTYRVSAQGSLALDRPWASTSLPGKPGVSLVFYFDQPVAARANPFIRLSVTAPLNLLSRSLPLPDYLCLIKLCSIKLSPDYVGPVICFRTRLPPGSEHTPLRLTKRPRGRQVEKPKNLPHGSFIPTVYLRKPGPPCPSRHSRPARSVFASEPPGGGGMACLLRLYRLVLTISPRFDRGETRNPRYTS